MGHDLAVELDDRDIAGRIHSTSLHEGGFDVLRVDCGNATDVLVGRPRFANLMQLPEYWVQVSRKEKKKNSDCEQGLM